MRDQESPPFISAAAATGSPIIAPGGTYPPQVYQLPPIAYVQSTGGMATQPMVQQVGQLSTVLKKIRVEFVPFQIFVILLVHAA